MSTTKFVVFTDLDGTLLDHHSYEFSEALPALQELKRQNTPVILASSKTSTEILALRNKLQNKDPYIVENGGAVFIPTHYFPGKISYQKKQKDYLVIELGSPYDKLRKALHKIKSDSGLTICGFGDLSPVDLHQLANISIQEAKLALNREYDEPFLIKNKFSDPDVEKISRLVSDLDLNLARGGRFFHLMGNNDKGTAVKKLISIFNKAGYGSIKSIGIGDSQNDLPMLEAVDLPILVQKPSKEYDREVIAQINPILAEGIGPKGWNDAVLKLLREYFQ